MKNRVRSFKIFPKFVIAWEYFAPSVVNPKPGLLWAGIGYPGKYDLFYWNHFTGRKKKGFLNV